MDAQTMELLEHHRCLCAQLPFGSAGSSPCARGWPECCYRSNGGSGYPHHSVGSASRLPAGFSSCRTTFARKVSWVSQKNSSRKLDEQASLHPATVGPTRDEERPQVLSVLVCIHIA